MIKNGFIDWAKRVDGIADKVYSAKNSGEWITCHSVVGQESEFHDGIPDRFLSTEQVSPGRYSKYAAASCMFVLRKNGKLIQMHPITASTWTSGGPEANTRSWAIEAEGGLNPYTEPLTAAQVTTFVKLVREWEAWSGKKAIPGVTLLQHKDVAAKFGYDATACASDRYAAAWAAVAAGGGAKPEEEDDVELQKKVTELERQVARLERIVAANGITIEPEKPTESIRTATGEEALAHADKKGWSAFLGIYQARVGIAVLESAPGQASPADAIKAGDVVRLVKEG